VKKGRHRRFEEARALKRTVEVVVEPCAECGAPPDEEHASWCLATEDLDPDIEGDDDDLGPGALGPGDRAALGQSAAGPSAIDQSGTTAGTGTGSDGAATP
jgi:hypothetical protein